MSARAVDRGWQPIILGSMVENSSHYKTEGGSSKERASCYELRANPPVNMNVVEASKYIGVSPRKLRELIALRMVKSVRIGKRIIMRREHLDSFLESQTV